MYRSKDWLLTERVCEPNKRFITQISRDPSNMAGRKIEKGTRRRSPLWPGNPKSPYIGVRRKNQPSAAQ